MADRRWTQAEVRILRRMHAQDLTFTEIAEALGRTNSACIGKAHKLGLGARDRDKSEQGRKGHQRMLRRLKAQWLKELEGANV